MTETRLSSYGDVDLLICSPDGESRGLIVRVGDLFPLDPSGHLLTGSFAEASLLRPWGLRYLRVPQPRCGKHEGATSSTSGGDNQPGTSEETRAD
jgi:hypothetical protein